MMKLSRLSSSRKQLFDGLAYKRAADVGDAFGLHPFSTRAGITSAIPFTPKAVGYTTDKIFAPYCVYKGKASLSLFPVLPTFTKMESGSVVMQRRGSVMLKFLPAIGERKYDPEKRQVFSLSATEVGTLISLGPKDCCEFFHDPSMLQSNAGQVRKTLSIKAQTDGNGYFISLTVVNNIQKTRENFAVPITAGEFAVMKTACSFALPHILGWDRLTKPPRSTEGLTSSNIDPNYLGLEWDK